MASLAAWRTIGCSISTSGLGTSLLIRLHVSVSPMRWPTSIGYSNIIGLRYQLLTTLLTSIGSTNVSSGDQMMVTVLLPLGAVVSFVRLLFQISYLLLQKIVIVINGHAAALECERS